MSTKARRLCAWLVGVASSMIIVALIITAVFDLQIGDSTSSVIAGVIAVAGLAISVITLIRSPASAVPPRTTAARVHSKGRGAIAAGGSVRGNAIGKNAKATGVPSVSAPASSPASPRDEVSAEGAGAISAGDDVADNAIGEDSER